MLCIMGRWPKVRINFVIVIVIVIEHTSFTMFAYDKTYDQTFIPNILICHYDLISRFSDFAFYLNTQWAYDHISFTL